MYIHIHIIYIVPQDTWDWYETGSEEANNCCFFEEEYKKRKKEWDLSDIYIAQITKVGQLIKTKRDEWFMLKEKKSKLLTMEWTLTMKLH